MSNLFKSMETVHNISLMDRCARLVLTAALITIPATLLGDMTAWHAFFMVFAIYTGITAFLGWDPFYQLAHFKTCGSSDRNQCGTLPYQIDAALGHHPKPEVDHDHSLSGCHR
jgi:hypothetical protein